VDKLETVFSGYLSNDDLENAKFFLIDTHVYITFWGCRKISHRDHEGSSMALERVEALFAQASTRIKNQYFEGGKRLTLEQRCRGIECIDAIMNMYLDCDREVQRAFWLTRVFYNIWYSTSSPDSLTPRSLVLADPFTIYNRDDHLRDFDSEMEPGFFRIHGLQFCRRGIREILNDQLLVLVRKAARMEAQEVDERRQNRRFADER